MTSDTCPFDCKAGYKKVGRACNKPNKGHYVNNTGQEVACSTITNGQFTPNPAGLNSNTCPFDCNPGFVKILNSRTCRVPARGKYADTDRSEKDCVSDGNLALPNGATWVAPAGERTKAQSCEFTCSANTIKINTSMSRSCALPGGGEYVDTNGVQKSCGSNAELNTRGGTGWHSDQSGVRTKTACRLLGCTDDDKVLDAGKTSCVNLSGFSGHYKDPTDHKPKPCGSTHASVGVSSWATDQSGVTQQSNCRIACATGTVPATSGASTGTTAQCEKECSPTNAPTDSGRKAWDSAKTGGANWSDTCRVVKCNAGYDDDNNDNSCTKTVKGYYAAGNDRKSRVQCVRDGITNVVKPGHADWSATTGLTSASQCNWSCDTGFTLDRHRTSCVCSPGTHLVGLSCVSSGRACDPAPANGQGSQVWGGGSGWDTCQITSCDGGFWKDGTGNCVAVTGKYVSKASDLIRTECTGQTIPELPERTQCVGCSGSEHTEDNIECVVNTLACTGLSLPSHASSAEKTWTLNDGWSNCEATGCQTNYHLEAPNCVSDTKACTSSGRAGQQTWTSGSWSGCQVIGCPDPASQTLYENTCYANSKSCTLDELPDNAASGTKTYDADGVYHACSVTCSTGYDFDTDSRECVPLVPSVTSVVVQGLKNIGGGTMATNKHKRNVKITATRVTHYYLTHDASFTPTDITGSGSTEGGRRWSTRKPTEYTFPKTDGIYTLYLWVADVEGIVSASSTASASFTLDVTAPIVEFAQKPALKSMKEKTFVLDITDTTPIKEYVYKHDDCDSWCAIGAQTTYCTYRNLFGTFFGIRQAYENFYQYSQLY